MLTRIRRGRTPFGALKEVPKHPTDHRFARAFLRAAAPILLLVFAIAVQPLSAQERTGAITLDDALRQFRARGFDLLLANASIAGAEGDIASTSAIANPQLSLARGRTSTYNPTLCAGCSKTSITAAITDQLAISDALTGKRRLRTDIARAALESAKHSRADAERTLGFAVKQQLLQAELGKQALNFAQEAQRLTAETLDLVTKRYTAGAVSEADVARAEVQKLEADQAVDVAGQSLAQADAALAFFLGYDDVPPGFDVADDLLRVTPSPRLAATSHDELLREALANRPDFASARAQLQGAQAAVDLAHRLRIPDVSPSLQYSREGSGQNALSPPTVTFGIAATLPVFNHYRGEESRAEADLQTRDISRKKIEAQIGSDVSSAFGSFTSARNRTTRMQDRLLDRAARARDLVRLQYEKGAASLFEFLDAQRTFLGTQTEYLQTLNDYWTAVFQLEQATGVELRP
jgi:outer membrane protein, heavy metal efflux system